MRALALIATIPARLRSCTRLLAELSAQTRKPDGVILCLDGYGEAPAPPCDLPIIATYRTAEPQGAGQRWRVAADLLPDDIIVCVDDDIRLEEAPQFFAALVKAVEDTQGAAAAMGRSPDGKQAPPGAVSRGGLVYGAGCGFTVRAAHLVGLEDLVTHVKATGGFDPLGLLGDDDAFISALLWRNKVPITHAATGNIYPAPGTHASSQTAAHRKKNTNPEAQKVALKKITGWPWPQKKAGVA